jgi:hypothetical protein
MSLYSQEIGDQGSSNQQGDREVREAPVQSTRRSGGQGGTSSINREIGRSGGTCSINTEIRRSGRHFFNQQGDREVRKALVQSTGRSGRHFFNQQGDREVGRHFFNQHGDWGDQGGSSSINREIGEIRRRFLGHFCRSTRRSGRRLFN